MGTQVLTFFFNAPCLIIVILVTWARFRFVNGELKATRLQMATLTKKWAHENEFLIQVFTPSPRFASPRLASPYLAASCVPCIVQELGDVTHRHEGKDSVKRLQERLDRTMLKLDR